MCLLTVHRPNPAGCFVVAMLVAGLIVTSKAEDVDGPKPADAESSVSAELYSKHVKPLLAEKCVSCHGPLEQNAGLRLDAGELIHESADGTDLILPSDARSSELLIRVGHEDEELRMPPPGEGTSLTAEEIELIGRWIASGAEFPDDETFLASAEQHWAFQPLTRPQVPRLADRAGTANEGVGSRSVGSGPINPIDAFLQAKRNDLGVQTLGRTDHETLLRRLTFDLTGLPPSADQRAAAMADGTSMRTIDSLLASPEHAQRWARHWMDVWRYSDWDGYKNELRGSQRHIWHWRDWIVDSLAADKPYDQMILEMLAADEAMPLDQDALRATGFLARNYHKSNRNIWLEATVEHTAKAFLGLTIDCAKCHDHKYDPLGQEEYYRFRAIFEPHKTRTDFIAGQADRELNGIPVAYDAELDAETQFLIAGDEKRPDESRTIEPRTPQILGIDLDIRPVDLPQLASVPHLRDDVRQTLVAVEQAKVARAEAALKVSPDDEVAVRKLAAARANLASFVARYDADAAKHDSEKIDEDKAQRLAIEATRMQLEHRLAEAELAVAQKRRELHAAEASDESEPEAKQKQIDEATEALAQAQKQRDAATDAVDQHAADPKAKYDSIVEVFPRTSSGRRLALARLITARENPLSARVAVNHIWMRHFGKPLVDNVFDFGLRSPKPLHHELLDWLAVELIEGGWRMKPLHRTIVTSQAFALASSGDPALEADNRRFDPDNETYWRFDPIRLEAEAIRDSLLAVGGELDRSIGGPDIDHQQGEQVLRRSLYFRHAYEKQMTMLTTFDAASPNECYRRDTSIIPQQALVLANSELARRMSETLADRLHRQVSESDVPDEPSTDGFIQAAFEHVLGRQPTEQERMACRQFLSSQPADTRSNGANRAEPNGNAVGSPGTGHAETSRASLIHVLINHNDFVTVR